MSDKRELKILLVEDESIARMMMQSILSKVYSHVVAAQNGLEGLEKFKAESPDIVITDLEMPVMTGAEMIREIRQVDETVPILVVSAYSDAEKSADLIQGRLIKPVFKKDLYSIIEQLFGLSRNDS